MIFNKNKYPILDDVGDKGVLLSSGASRAINDLKIKAKEVEEIFGAFCDKIIINCKKGYYLSKKINDTLSEDGQCQIVGFFLREYNWLNYSFIILTIEPYVLK